MDSKEPKSNRHLTRKITACLAISALLCTAKAAAPARSPENAQYILAPGPLNSPHDYPVAPYVAPTPTDQPDRQPSPTERATRSQRQAEPPQTVKAEIVIAYALAQQGDPYRWNTAGPNSFDCSGLVLAAFARVGIGLPHFTGSMMSKGMRISREGMKRGDIVFPTSGHVAIYLGNNMMVAASSGRGRVIVQKVYSFYTARRVF